MRKMTKKALAAVLVACFTMPAMQAFAATTETSDQGTTAQAGPSAAERQQYEQNQRRHLQHLQRDLSRLQKDAGNRANRSVQIAAANLSVGLDLAKRKLADLTNASAPVWRHLRAGLDNTIALLDRGIRKLDSQLRNNNHEDSRS